MKIISLWEPWASLVALGWKMIETRSWSTGYRGDVAIHAAKNRTAIRDGTPNRLLEESGLLARGIAGAFAEDHPWPLGKIVAVVRIADCAPTTSKHDRLISMPFHEMKFGNYGEGRFAFMLENLRPVKPLACTGQRGLRDLPPEIEARLEYLPMVAA